MLTWDVRRFAPAWFFGALGILFAHAWPSVAIAQGPGDVTASNASTNDPAAAGRLESKRLWAEATRLWNEDKFAQAIVFAEQATSNDRRVLGDNAVDVANSIEVLVADYIYVEDWTHATARCQEVIAWRERLQGADHWQTSDARRVLDRIRALARLTPQDRQRLKQADADDAEHARLYNQGRFDDALRLIERAAATYQQILGRDNEVYARAVHSLAYVHMARAEYRQAEPLFMEALAVRKKVLGEKHPLYAQTLNGLATLYERLGEYQRAEPLYLQALEIRRAVFGDQHPDYATMLNNLANLYVAKGDLARAGPLYQQALDIRRRSVGTETTQYAMGLNNLGTFYTHTGEFERAVPLLREAMEIRKRLLGEKHPDYAASLMNLALAYCATGPADQIAPLFKQALAIRREVYGTHHPLYAESLDQLATEYCMHRQYAEAEPLHLEALKIRQEILGDDHPLVADSLTSLGLLYHSMGQFDRAEPYYRRALDIQTRIFGPRNVEVATCLSNLGALLRARGQHEQAATLFRQALDIVIEHRNATAVIQDEQGQIELGAHIQDWLECYLSLLVEGRVPAGDAYDMLLRCKGATLVRQRAARLVAEDPAVAEVFAELQSTVSRWAAMEAAGNDGSPDWQRQIDALLARKRQLETQLASTSASFRDAAGEVHGRDIAHVLADDAALVDYFTFWYSRPSTKRSGELEHRHVLMAFVVRHDGRITALNLGDVDAVDKCVEGWRSSFGVSASSRADGLALRQQIWEPLEAELVGARTVLVSPDGSLGRLPFAALPGRVAKSYLIEDYRLALVPVPRLVPSLAARSATAPVGGDLLLVGDVDYDARPTNTNGSSADATAPSAGDSGRPRAGELAPRSWPRLPGAKIEVETIASIYREALGARPDACVELSGGAATEEQFRKSSAHARLVHLATHGFFLAAPERDKPPSATDAAGRLFRGRLPEVRNASPGLLSGLVLAGANSARTQPHGPDAGFADDGLLTAEELAFLPLGGVDLAVLSACETGLGESAVGEGLLGLQRAIQVAGVRSTVATLWKVDDAMTQRLMTMFYRNIFMQKQSYLDALRNAQLELLKELRTPTFRGASPPEDLALASDPSPRLWAAFTFAGDWR